METNNKLEFQIAYSQIIRIAWLVILIVSVVLVAIGSFVSEPWYALQVSFLLGAAVNLFAFNLLRNSIGSLTGDDNGYSSTFSNYTIRFAIYGFILFIAFNNAVLNQYLVAVGFLTVRVAIYIYSFRKKEE